MTENWELLVLSINLVELGSQLISNLLSFTLCACVCVLPLSCSSAGPGLISPPVWALTLGQENESRPAVTSVSSITLLPPTPSLPPPPPPLLCAIRWRDDTQQGLFYLPPFLSPPSTPFVLLLQEPQSLPHNSFLPRILYVLSLIIHTQLVLRLSLLHFYLSHTHTEIQLALSRKWSSVVHSDTRNTQLSADHVKWARGVCFCVFPDREAIGRARGQSFHMLYLVTAPVTQPSPLEINKWHAHRG